MSPSHVILAQAQTEEEEEEQQQTEEQQPAEEAPAGQQAAPEAEQAPAQAETDAPADEPAATDEATTDEPAAQDTAEPTTDQAPAEQQAAPEADQDPAQAETDAPADQPAATDEATTDEPASQDTAEPTTDEAPAERQAAPEADQDPAQAETDAPADEPAATDEATTDEPASQDAAQPTTGQEPAEQQAAPEADQDPAQADADQPNTGEQAPILDSAKEAAPAGAEGTQPEGQAAGEQDQQQQQGQQQRRLQATTPPTSDAEAQANIQVEEIEPVTAEEGERIEIENTREARREARRERRERRQDARVVREFDDNRVIVEFGDRVFIESPDYERIIFDDDEVYYESLPRGRTREVIVRRDGSRVVTIRNRYGDIVRRSRILPDDREIVLVYVEDRYYDEVLEFRDPGASLPPLQLTIPREEYILEAESVESPDAYYAFFDQPPVDQLERTYSVEEVKRSARIRDTVRRIDLDTINFEFGSAEIAESEIDELAGVAEAIQRLLEENPAETFLIEGHTDAVGSDLANLALSDRRAESVATALTGSFDIPPENLVTQGYGEQYLKVETTEAERENRRVAMRRITPLVKPVASAE